MSDLSGVFLPDVNLLVAIAWPNHLHHRQARAWFVVHADRGWATCRLVELGFLRVSMRQDVVGSDMPWETVHGTLRTYCSDQKHHYWLDDSSPFDWPSWLQIRIQGNRQVSDAALVHTAIVNGGVLATIDSGITSLVPKEYRGHVAVVPI